jgi:hypothetical protein
MAPLVLRFGKAYTNLQPRITKTLINAFLDLSRPLTTHYGAIVGLSSLGHYVTQLLILPNLKSYLTLLEPELNGTNTIRRLEAKKCYGALLVRNTHTHTHAHNVGILISRLVSLTTYHLRKRQGAIWSRVRRPLMRRPALRPSRRKRRTARRATGRRTAWRWRTVEARKKARRERRR